MQEQDAKKPMTLYDQLEELAYNLRWAWNPGLRKVFRALDPELWEQLRHNPVAVLRRLDRDAINGRAELADDIRRFHEELQHYLSGEGAWYSGEAPDDRPLVAYFSAEFGITECLRIYSGGLGVLAGDHLKSASDLGIPLTAIGLLYREGYFKQGVDAEGRQTEQFPVADFEDLPVRAVLREDGSPAHVTVPFPGRQVRARIWRAQVGRVALHLLDADLEDNRPEDRRITARLYGGGHEMRISQEILLGMGGYRALETLELSPRSYHMNEGHSAFLGLELVRDFMQNEDLSFDEARQAARARCVFTTHTPVPAGHDRFPRELMEKYLTPTAHGLGLEFEALMDLGRERPGSDGPFTMTVLALGLATRTNGVSELHGAVSREMWHHLWGGRAVDEVPIDHITNGIHAPSWVHPAIVDTWGVGLHQVGVENVEPDPDGEALWRVHEERRSALADYVARTVGATLNPKALTIAFARRFATYKRATLLLSDLDRLAGLVGRTDRPVQVIFSGKAHPKDEGGKALIRRIGQVSRDERFQDRIVFLPDYGMDVARELVQGADVWLNNPRRPMEASGTSGMKAAMNGVLNVSILDGWWDEAWRDRDPERPDPGWPIGAGRTGVGEEADAGDANALFSVLEHHVVPTFYERGDDHRPHHWISRMRESIRQVAPVFNTDRMLTDYLERYREAAEREEAGTLG